MKEKAKNKVTIEDLAIMVAKGFENTATKDDFNMLKGEIGDVKKDVESLKKDVESLKKDVEKIKQDIEGMNDRLDGTNNRIDDLAETKVSKIKHKELEDQVAFLVRKKTGVKI